MNREGHEQVDFFVGREVEHSPAFGHLTMFVVGVRPETDINLAIDTHYRLGGKPITHMYFGANQSFPNPEVNDAPTWKSWENMIVPFLQTGYLCTLDIDVKSVEGLVEGPLCEFNNFIPMISVKLPSLQLLGYNATIKLDDKDFAATNPGVWCHSLHDLKDRKVFTDWSKYTKDEVIK
jgi:hypothetical protein